MANKGFPLAPVAVQPRPRPLRNTWGPGKFIRVSAVKNGVCWSEDMQKMEFRKTALISNYFLCPLLKCSVLLMLYNVSNLLVYLWIHWKGVSQNILLMGHMIKKMFKNHWTTAVEALSSITGQNLSLWNPWYCLLSSYLWEWQFFGWVGWDWQYYFIFFPYWSCIRFYLWNELMYLYYTPHSTWLMLI